MSTKVNARLLLASANAVTGDILFTWELTFPRQILAEFNTHRKLSRNTSSSRAISIQKLRASVKGDPFVPVYIGTNQKGKQAGAELAGWRRFTAEWVIRVMRYPALLGNYTLDKLGAHKQVANRYLEPWMWCKVVCSATDVNNLLLLRTDAAAEPHFRELAQQMQAQVTWCRGQRRAAYPSAFNGSVRVVRYQVLQPGEWHLPYVTYDEHRTSIEAQLQISAGRCANTSYTLPGETRSIDRVLAAAICGKLFGGPIKHLSPTEHQAQAMLLRERYANFRSFRQWRSSLPNENGGD
jgi:hypothetical protein